MNEDCTEQVIAPEITDDSGLTDTHEPKPKLTAGRVIAVVGLWLVGQVIGAFIGVIALMLKKAFEGMDVADPDVIASLRGEMMAYAVSAGVILSGIGVLLLCVVWFRRELRDTEPTGGAWVSGSWNHIYRGLFAGAGIGVIFVIVTLTMLGGGQSGTRGPLAEMATTPGFQQNAWLVLALLFAPVIEEPLFRGVFYAGLRRSWGPTWAAILTTVVFFFMHITEMIHFWPSMIFVFAMAVGSLWIRLRTRAVGPAMAFHFAYNAVLGIYIVLKT